MIIIDFQNSDNKIHLCNLLGISLQVKQLLERNGGNVIATCRNPLESTGLNELKAKFSDRLDILKLDITDENSIQVNWKDY